MRWSIRVRGLIERSSAELRYLLRRLMWRLALCAAVFASRYGLRFSMAISLESSWNDDGLQEIRFVIPDELREQLNGTDLLIMESLINKYLEHFTNK